MITQQQGLHQQLVTKSTLTEHQLGTSKTMQFHLSMKKTPSLKKQNWLQKQLMRSLGCQWGGKLLLDADTATAVGHICTHASHSSTNRYKHHITLLSLMSHTHQSGLTYFSSLLNHYLWKYVTFKSHRSSTWAKHYELIQVPPYKTSYFYSYGSGQIKC